MRCRGLPTRVRAIEAALAAADIQAQAVADGRIPIWEKFIFLVALAGFTGAARLPIGPIWQDLLMPRAVSRRRPAKSRRSPAPKACRWPPTSSTRIPSYIEAIPGTMRSSLLIDLSQGKRIEVEALHGAVVRRAAAAGVPVPIMATLYAVLKPWARPTRLRIAS